MQTDALPAQTGVQRIDYDGIETRVFQESENIAVVVSRGFEPCFYFARILFNGLDFEQQIVKPVYVVLYCKNIVQNLTLGINDKAVMLVLCNVDSDINHNDTPFRFI